MGNFDDCVLKERRLSEAPHLYPSPESVVTASHLLQNHFRAIVYEVNCHDKEEKCMK